ncbi:MAG TPA: polysaccharide biosynthesis/export family protein, partial [Nevskiaceae bacterium]|nr:polysaccharide biosynthesis/export family protein [Nevskiaceae bacterium]
MLLSGVATAQIPPELLEKYQNLSPEQRQQVLQQAGQASTAGPETIRQGDVVTQPVTVTPLQPPASDRGKERTDAGEGLANEQASGKLKPFGYDLFAGLPTTFAPATDIPIPKEYVLGPGDVIEAQLFGKQNTKYSLTVQRDGSIQFPELGPIQVAGLPFEDMQRLLQQQISNRLIGVQAAITLGPLRSIRVFVLGNARNPGSYTVSSLSTITNALFASGGVAETGSLRRIQLKRQGQLISTLDLYDLLMRGDTSADERLQPGDVIFIPPLGVTVGVSGEVRRPAIYELSTGIASAMDLVSMAG